MGGCLVQASLVRYRRFGGQGCPTAPQVGDLDCFVKRGGQPLTSNNNRNTQYFHSVYARHHTRCGRDSPPGNCRGESAGTNSRQAELSGASAQHGEPQHKHADRHGDFASVHGHIGECRQGQATGATPLATGTALSKPSRYRKSVENDQCPGRVHARVGELAWRAIHGCE